VCALAAAGCGNGAPAPEAGTTPVIAPDAGPDVSDGAPDVASSVDSAAPEVPDAASVDQSTAPDIFASPEVGAPDVPPGRVLYRAIALSIGENHACVILDDHKVKCWGDNVAGQLGLGDTRDRGASPSEMGDNLPTVDLGPGRTAKAIVARVYTTCALLDDGSVKCWGAAWPAGAITPLDLAGRKATSLLLGENGNGCVTTDDQSVLCWGGGGGHYKPAPPTLRPGVTVVDLAFGFVPFALFGDGTIWSLGSVPAGVPPVAFPLDSGTHARALFAAYSRLCATLDTGGLKCWMTNVSNGSGAVPPPTSDTDVESVAFTASGAPTCWLKSGGAVECASYKPPQGPSPGSTGLVPLGRPAVAIDGGGEAFVCALLDDGSVKCWSDGQTGATWLGGSDPAIPGWPAVNLGTRPAP
jgi:hypothetical protein